ncbi:hypothetical protein ES705_50034 [subsurface metagenome]
MPYPNYHSCLINPELTKVLGTQTRIHKGKKYSVRIARAEGKTKGSGERSYLYSIKDWTKKEARDHCKEAKGEFHPAEKKTEHFILRFFRGGKDDQD